MERLTKVMTCPDGTKLYDISNKLFGLDVSRATKTRMVLEKLAIYEDAEEQGLLLRLPCKVGDTVYQVNKVSKKISKHKVLKIEMENMDGTDFIMQIWFGKYSFTFGHRFGEVIFLTREEAETKLKEMENSHE